MSTSGASGKKREFLPASPGEKKFFFLLYVFSHGTNLFFDISVVGTVWVHMFYLNHHLLLDFELLPITIVAPKTTYEQQKTATKKRNAFPAPFGLRPVDNCVDYCG